MISNCKQPVVIGIGLLCLLTVLSAPMPVEAHGTHPGQATRVGECSKPDQQTDGVARHTTGYAVERFGLKDLLSKTDFDRASRQMGHFLTWKLGSKTAVCGRYVSAGYGHFERTYGEEAAAMLLGALTFSRQNPTIVVPRWMMDFIGRGVDEPSSRAITDFFLSRGVPLAVAKPLGAKVATELSTPFPKVVAAYIPKTFDVDNRVVKAYVQAKREATAQATAGATRRRVRASGAQGARPSLSIDKTEGPVLGGGYSKGTFGGKGLPDLGGGSYEDPQGYPPESDYNEPPEDPYDPGDQYYDPDDQYYPQDQGYSQGEYPQDEPYADVPPQEPGLAVEPRVPAYQKGEVIEGDEPWWK